MYQLDINKQSLFIEGQEYFATNFRVDPFPSFAKKSNFHNDLYHFLKDWFSDNPCVEVQTSGSTGKPKKIQVEKKRMMQSAILTCSFLGLKPKDTLLLCMDLKYIGAKMMVVRALVSGMDVYATHPSGNPLKEIDVRVDFGSMVPLQVFNSLQSDDERQKLMSIKKLIIGGGAIDPVLGQEIKQLPHEIYSTYGMTETLSHIALRKLNGTDASDYYVPFDSIRLSQSEDGALIIDAPDISTDTLYTNDIVDINDKGHFRILGRKDNIINSGGIKIQIEELEAKLKPFINGNFAISSLPDPKFGEIVVLISEVETDINKIKDVLPSYHLPKKIIQIDRIPLTETGKIARQELKNRIL